MSTVPNRILFYYRSVIYVNVFRYRSELKLESLEDAVVLDNADDDWLSDKHGCPAYVSPEILKCNTRYSGRMADMWGLGVMLYTMLVGRYEVYSNYICAYTVTPL